MPGRRPQWKAPGSWTCLLAQHEVRQRLPPHVLAARLASAKAAAVAAELKDQAWALGSDQVAELDGAALGKPGHRDRAIAQLAAMSGRRVRFHTALCLARADGASHCAIDLTEVHVRTLDRATIERYVDAEQPFDCAGSFKAEGLGIALFERIDSQDPTALVGLPLIATCAVRRRAGFVVP
jgi:septum formation protein